jgi:hypothetical protein
VFSPRGRIFSFHLRVSIIVLRGNLLRGDKTESRGDKTESLGVFCDSLGGTR